MSFVIINYIDDINYYIVIIYNIYDKSGLAFGLKICCNFNMKKIICFFSIFICHSLYAVEGFICNPSDRQTRIQIVSVNDAIEARITNPAGYEFMPQFDGPVSKFSMTYQKFQYDALEILGDIFIITWPKKSCQFVFENFYLKCDSEGTFSKPLQGIKSKGLETVKISEEYHFGKYESQKYRFTFDKEGNYLFVSLQFNKENCKQF